MKLSEFKLNYQPMIEAKIKEDIPFVKEEKLEVFLEGLPQNSEKIVR